MSPRTAIPLLAALAALAAAPAARADQVIAGDAIVQGAVCTGLDCVAGEAFGTDTLRLKENNTRLAFDDTSASGNDWELTANQSISGGSNSFGILDRTAFGTQTDRQSLRLLAGAPADVLLAGPTGLPVLTRGPLLERVNATTTKDAAPADGPAVLGAVGDLPLSTYATAADPAARHLGPLASAFGAVVGVGGADDVAAGDLAGAALTAMQQLAVRVATVQRGPAGPQGSAGAAGAKGPAGDRGPDGTTRPDFTPSAGDLGAFNRRLGALAASQRRLVASQASTTRRLIRAAKRLR